MLMLVFILKPYCTINMIKILLFLLLSTKIILRSEVAGKIRKQKENLFQSINTHLQDIVNKIFMMLKLSKSLAVTYENRLLLALHASLKKSSEKKYMAYVKLSEIAKIDKKHIKRANNSLFLLDNIVNSIIKEDSEMYTSSRKSNHLESETESIEIPDKVGKAHAALRQYLYNDDNFELADIAKPFNRITEIYEKHKQLQRATRRNLKAWKATNATELLEETRRVFTGRIVEIKKFPFIVSVHVEGKFLCTGSIISREMIITAASCLQAGYYNPDYLKENPDAVAVRIGSDYPDREGDLVSVLDIYIHPLYRPSTLRNNLAIIRIKKFIYIGKKSIKMRRIEYQKITPNIAPASGSKIVLFGWGDKDAPTSDAVEDIRLSYANLDVIKLQSCMETYTTTYVSEKNFCAGTAGKGAGACQRDIGGPAVANSQLVGVVSFGPPICGTTDASTVFTSIAYQLDWINSIVSQVVRKSKSLNATEHSRPDLLIETKNNKSLNVYNKLKELVVESKTNKTKVHNPNAMHLLSYALRQIMDKSYEWIDNEFSSQPSIDPLLLKARQLANTLQNTNLHSTPYDIVIGNRVFRNENLILRQSSISEQESEQDNDESDEIGLSIEIFNHSAASITKENESLNKDASSFIEEDDEKTNIKEESNEQFTTKNMKIKVKKTKSVNKDLNKEADNEELIKISSEITSTTVKITSNKRGETFGFQGSKQNVRAENEYGGVRVDENNEPTVIDRTDNEATNRKAAEEQVFYRKNQEVQKPMTNNENYYDLLNGEGNENTHTKHYYDNNEKLANISKINIKQEGGIYSTENRKSGRRSFLDYIDIT